MPTDGLVVYETANLSLGALTQIGLVVSKLHTDPNSISLIDSDEFTGGLK